MLDIVNILSLVLLAFITSPSCECCTACRILLDEFTRADSDSLGSDWTEETTDCDISSNQLALNNSGARALTTATHPDSVGNLYAACNVTLPTSGDKVHLIVGWQDSSNYVYLEAHNSGTGANCRIRKAVGGSHSTVKSFTASYTTGNTVTMSLCCQSGAALGQFSTGEVYGSVTPPGDKCGVEGDVVGGSAILIDDFEMWNTASSANVACRPCSVGVTCCDGDAPIVLRAVLSSFSDTGNCLFSNWNGTYFVPLDAVTASRCRWEAFEVLTGHDGGAGPCNFAFDNNIKIEDAANASTSFTVYSVIFPASPVFSGGMDVADIPGCSGDASCADDCDRDWGEPQVASSSPVATGDVAITPML